MSETTQTLTADPAAVRPSSVIVVGYSSKIEGRAALEHGVSEATLRGSELVVVHTSPDVEQQEIEAELAASGVRYQITSVTETLDPAEELISAAETHQAAFIVIGLRRRSPVGKLLLGSNAQRVLLDAACPVLAVKATADPR
jgi:nucleotide-binding universal stress UspA family protein